MFFREALPELRRMAEYFARNEMPPLRTGTGEDHPAETAEAARLRGSRGAPAGGAPTAGAKAPGRNDPCPCGSGRKFKNCCGR